MVNASDMEIAENIGHELDMILHMVPQSVRLNHSPHTMPSASSSSTRIVTRENLAALNDATPPAGEDRRLFFDPKKVIEDDLNMMVHSLPETVKSKDSMVNSAARYFFKKTGKMFRPTVVILIGRAVQAGLHTNVADVVAVEESRRRMEKVLKLAEVTEMIHVASLIHDDIVDEAETRRGVTTLHKILGNRAAVQSGDYLLARACFELASLENHEVSQLKATSIEHLASGEISQMCNKGSDSFERYMQAIFCKTASIIAHSAKASAVLAGADEHLKEQAYTYGKHLGIAYQVRV